ncbi:hypothetical protein Fmac_008368 [Flemingia macrophylla]|uniref:Uncharacterized protein n=1 Tax=Flemingia macrophylla TaxID=520843 RepID=A0ABD1MYE0_9FABA
MPLSLEEFMMLLEGKLDALVNLVTLLDVNQKSASVARLTTTAGEARHLIKKMASNSQQFGARYDAIIIRGFHHVAIDTSAEIRKLKGKLDALVNLMTQLTMNQKSTSNAIQTSIADHHNSRGQILDKEDDFQPPVVQRKKPCHYHKRSS